ncbi:MAG TPA: GNAT family N-acetyltransferase [Casimicrobiaceae bacterium]|nr:GNAT family N-acetyltransferase [Casimicrobiaceae bacterium]
MSATAPAVPNPLLIDIPEELTGPRVRARRYREGDGATVAAAVAESRDRLVAAAMPWVQEWDDPNQPTIFVRRAQAQWAAREGFLLGLWDRASDDFLGSSGVHRIDWSVPNVEIGYWLRSQYEGVGLMTEAVAMIAAFAFDALRAQRVRIRCDARNARSAAVPRRLGFVHEATLRNDARNADGTLRDTFEFGLTPEEFHAARAGPWRAILSC